jgi:threonine/homoserine/homoserine lactone efflux protein
VTLLAASASAFAVVRYLGAAYLVWLGVRMLTHARDRSPAGLEVRDGFERAPYRTDRRQSLCHQAMSQHYGQ